MRIRPGMPLRLTGRAISLSLSLLLLLAFSPAAAGESGSVLQLKYEFFRDRNRAWNHTPAFSLRYALQRVWTLGWEQEFDVVSGASRRLGASLDGKTQAIEPDAVTGASKVEARYSENPSLTYSRDGKTISGSLYASRESDYTSFSPAGSASMDFNGRNTTVGISYAEFFDAFQPKGAFAGEGGDKRIRTGAVTLAQSLTPLTLVAITGTASYADGYLGHPYNPPIDARGDLLAERVPESKTAAALAAQIVQGFRLGERLGSINLDARAYRDDWGLGSGTLDLKVSRYFSETGYVRLRARGYAQTGAAFAKDVYAGDETFRTGDIRLSRFSSLLVGAKIAAGFPDSWSDHAFLPDRWDLKFDYLVRDTRGDLGDASATESRGYHYQLYGSDEYYAQGVILAGLAFDL